MDIRGAPMFRWLVVMTAVLGLAGCGGDGGDEPDPPPEARTGLKVLTVDFNCDFVNQLNFSSSGYTVPSTTTTVCISGFIESNVPVAWSNSAGGSGQAFPEKVNCAWPPDVGCQLVWSIGHGSGGIPLQTGI